MCLISAKFPEQKNAVFGREAVEVEAAIVSGGLYHTSVGTGVPDGPFIHLRRKINPFFAGV